MMAPAAMCKGPSAESWDTGDREWEPRTEDLSCPTGHWAVVREGLTNPWIPDNWSWGGVASEHCPVLAEFYSDKDWSRKEAPRNGGSISVEHSEAHSRPER